MAFRAHWRVVESVRRLILVQEAVGSSPTSPAIGASASGLSQQFLVLLFVGSNPTAPSKCDIWANLKHPPWMLHHADDSSFQREVIQHSTPVLVEFFTDSCGPCRQLEPHLHSLAQKYAGKLKIVKIRSDDEGSSEVVSFYNIKTAPTFIMFVDGHPHRKLNGAPPPIRLDALSKEFSNR